METVELAGELRPVRGALALALALRRAPHRRGLVLPRDSAAAAAHVSGLDIRAADSLLQWLRGGDPYWDNRFEREARQAEALVASSA